MEEPKHTQGPRSTYDSNAEGRMKKDIAGKKSSKKEGEIYGVPIVNHKKKK